MGNVTKNQACDETLKKETLVCPANPILMSF